MIAKYPNACCICRKQFVPGESEIELHPTLRGERGGKKYNHVECAGQLPAPPDEIHVPMMSNPLRIPKMNPLVSVRNNGGCGCGGNGW